MIKEINTENEIPLPVILDTKGPEIRIGKFKEPVILKDNSTVIVTTEPLEFCTEERIEISYKNIPKIVSKGSFIYIADGTVELVVEKVEETVSEVKEEVVEEKTESTEE